MVWVSSNEAFSSFPIGAVANLVYDWIWFEWIYYCGFSYWSDAICCLYSCWIQWQSLLFPIASPMQLLQLSWQYWNPFHVNIKNHLSIDVELNSSKIMYNIEIYWNDGIDLLDLRHSHEERKLSILKPWYNNCNHEVTVSMWLIL